jgi:type II secretory pathway pseudopilin PulG
MKTKDKAGFTIIETMLFLGITGLLVAGMLIGTGSSVNIQRYHDSVTSLQSFFEQQFSNVNNVDNDRSNNWTCDSNATVTEQTSGGTYKGQSDCVILGRFIRTTDDGNKLSVKDVIGYIPATLVSASNDIEALQQYKIKVSPVSDDTYLLGWGALLVKPQPYSNDAAQFSILILRSPSSGVIRTFINSSQAISDYNVATLINQSALTQSAKMCVNSNGLFTGARSAVVVMPNATQASGVETQGENSGC